MPIIKVVSLNETPNFHQYQYRFFSEQERELTPPLTKFERLGLNYKMSEGQDPIETLTPDEANRIIHSHRKVRYGKHAQPSQPTCTPVKIPDFEFCTTTTTTRKLQHWLKIFRHCMLAMSATQGQVRQ
jgi:hypothetical protein